MPTNWHLTRPREVPRVSRWLDRHTGDMCTLIEAPRHHSDRSETVYVVLSYPTGVWYVMPWVQAWKLFMPVLPSQPGPRAGWRPKS